MLAKAFEAESIALALKVIETEIPFGIWETIYATVVSTAFAILIGLPLGMLLVAGDTNGVKPLPKWFMSQIGRAHV